ncbi:MAG: hypothetical protein HKM02_03985 [Pseudomonadales bacterium]|nr:hypothetical protein [Pseudomonadales bacterium]
MARPRESFMAFAGGVLSLLASLSTSANTVTVGTNCTLDNALVYLQAGASGSTGSTGNCASASTTSSGNTITIPAGQYQLTHTETITSSITITGAGQLSNTDTSQGAKIGDLGSTETRIVAPAGQRAFVIMPTTTTTVAGVTTTSPNQVTLSQLSIVGGTAADDCTSLLGLPSLAGQMNGGAICSGAILSLTNVELRGNQAANLGGAVFIGGGFGGTLTLSGAAFMGNSVTSSTNATGAAIFSGLGLVYISSASFFDQCDTTAAAPATAPAACPAGINDYTLAVYGLPQTLSSTQQTWSNLTISMNQASAIYDESKLILNNSDIVNNLSGITLPTSSIFNVKTMGVILYLSNSIVAGNNNYDCINFSTSGVIQPPVANMFSIQGGCPVVDSGSNGPIILFGGGAIGNPLPGNKTMIGFEGMDSFYNIFIDPTKPDQTLIAPANAAPTDVGILAPLGNYGGSLWTHKERFLLAYDIRDQSPVIGRGGGGGATISTVACTTVDARGFNRNGCDIGTDQYQYPTNGTLALKGVEGQPLTSGSLNTQLGDSDLIPVASSSSNSLWTCSSIYANSSLTGQAQSTAPGCAWVVPDALTAGSGGMPATNTRGSVVFNGSAETLTYTPATVFYGAASFNLRLTTTSSIFNADYNSKFITESVSITDQPASGITSKTLGVGPGAGSEDEFTLLSLLSLAALSQLKKYKNKNRERA